MKAQPCCAKWNKLIARRPEWTDTLPWQVIHQWALHGRVAFSTQAFAEITDLPFAKAEAMLVEARGMEWLVQDGALWRRKLPKPKATKQTVRR